MGLTDKQQACVNTLDKPLVIPAGAGSGKTFTLTQRIAHALEEGYVSDIGQVCAITFTRKAAGELKSRIKGELRARNMVDQALKVDDAWISTIHGMCARILRAHAIELGIDPSFGVIEPDQIREYLSRAVNEVLEEAEAQGGDPEIDELFSEYNARSGGFNDTSIEGMLNSLVLQASTHAHGMDDIVAAASFLEPVVALQQVVDLLEPLMEQARLQASNEKRDTWLGQTEYCVQEIKGLIQNPTESLQDMVQIAGQLKVNLQFGSQDYKALAREAKSKLFSLVLQVRLAYARQYLTTLQRLAERALQLYDQRKQSEGMLDNSDLLVMAARAIQDYPDIAAEYTDKFKLIMVDEFQDTDQMQVDMIKRIAGKGAIRLCTVGDAQQSIYRFRGADVSVYRRHLRAVQRDWSDDSVIKLDKNFRSHSDILKFVDWIFERPSMFGGEYMSLGHGRDESKEDFKLEDGHPRIQMQHTSYVKGIGVNTAREEAARRIAETFAQLNKEGHPASEMVVLMSALSHVDIYARALRKVGLPCVVSGGSVFASADETQLILSLVRVIANPQEYESLFNVLTGPLFCLTAADLVQVSGVKNFWRAVVNPEEVHGRVSEQLSCALRVMGILYERAGECSVYQLAEQVVTESGWLTRLQGQGAEGYAVAGNVFKALRMVRSLEESNSCGPVALVKRFQDTLEESKEAPGALSVSGGNSVRIMTIHASKGLEFPIVAVAEFRDTSGSSSKLLSASVEGKTYVSLDLNATVQDHTKIALKDVADYVVGVLGDEDEMAHKIQTCDDALKRRILLDSYNNRGETEEAKRLLYVALTRAREALILSSIGSASSKNPAGVPKNVLGAVLQAFEEEGAALDQPSSVISYGGSAPAKLQCVSLAPDPEDEQSADEEMADAGATNGDNQPFLVPNGPLMQPLSAVAWRPLHQGIFSYSSLADASHKGDLLARLADEYAISVDEAADSLDAINGFNDVRAQSGGVGNPAPDDMFAAGDDAPLDDAWELDASALFDEDRATSLGTAFHRLAQYAVIARKQSEPLAMPPAQRVQALMKSCAISGTQEVRLRGALQRWFGSQLCVQASALSQLSAEVPFFVKVGDVYLEGEIDLLGYDETGAHAQVIDYKTGGSASESADDLRCKHVLQAACYAYALLLQGAQSVQAVFVRVERPQLGDNAQPQCVRYRFEAHDRDALSVAIQQAVAQV